MTALNVLEPGDGNGVRILAPCLGEHIDQSLSEILGHDVETIASRYQRGVLQ